MTRVLVVIGGLLALGIAIVLLLGLPGPQTLSIRRTIAIAAPPEKVFPLLADFHNWGRWAPQDLEDPALQRSYSGASAGRGAVSDWRGHGHTGAGRMQITGASPPYALQVTVDFTRPFAAHNINGFTLIARGNSTQVTWDLTAQNLYVMRLMGLFVDMNAQIGRHLDRGLAALRAAAEKN
jgi:uncharacterized protein YndB with AHSA1/START domain